MDKRQKALHEWAMGLFHAAVDREAELRGRQQDDWRFACLDQWPADIRNARERDPNGPRPCLTIDKVKQYQQQIINEIRKNRPSVRVRPVDDKADPATAKVLQEKVRHIEDRSSANIAYETAGEWAVDVGEGYFRIITGYAEDGNQEILIRPIMSRFSVYMGPNLMPDSSDSKHCFVTEDMGQAAFRAMYPKAKYKAEDLEAPGDMKTEWMADNGVRVAEFFYLESEKVEEDAAEAGEKAKPGKQQCKWMKMTAVEILEERDFPSQYIPVVKVVGVERVIDGKVDRWGLYRAVKDAQRLYNYWASVLVENLGLTARAKWIAAAGQIEGHEMKWAKSNTSSDPVLTYNPLDVNGQAVPPPSRVPGSMPDAGILQQLRLIEHDIQTSLGMFKASVGDTQQGEQSGRAIKALQNQSDTATFHFPDNLARSIRHGGRIIIDMIPRVYDTRQMLRLIGDDDKPGMALIDPQSPVAFKRVQVGEEIRAIYNPSIGIYDVTATVGASHATKRMEATEFMMEVVKQQPELLKLIGHVMFREMDINGADKIADIFERMLPPPLREPKDGQPPLPPEVVQRMTQMEEVMKAMKAELDQEKAGTAEAQMKLQAQAQAEQQRIMLNDQNAKAQLQVQATMQAAQAQLAREKAEADHALKVWIAEKDAELDRMKAAAEAERLTAKAEMDRAFRLAEHESAERTEVNEAAPKIADTFTAVMQGFDALVKRMEGNRLTALRPIKDGMGNIIAGTADYASGETRQITLQ